jgi:Tfp pilus assembly pilus retraction ATPase PilT
MAADEDMAIRFYKVGDAEDLAEQLIAILQSHDLERQMAEHNFAAGVEMTMTHVVGNYLRWFKLNQCKQVIRGAEILEDSGRFRLSAEPGNM